MFQYKLVAVWQVISRLKGRNGNSLTTSFLRLPFSEACLLFFYLPYIIHHLTHGIPWMYIRSADEIELISKKKSFFSYDSAIRQLFSTGAIWPPEDPGTLEGGHRLETIFTHHLIRFVTRFIQSQFSLYFFNILAIAKKKKGWEWQL